MGWSKFGVRIDAGENLRGIIGAEIAGLQAKK